MGVSKELMMLNQMITHGRDQAINNPPERLQVSKNLHSSCLCHTEWGCMHTTSPSVHLHTHMSSHACIFSHPGPCNGNPRPTSSTSVSSSGYIISDNCICLMVPPPPLFVMITESQQAWSF